MPNALKVLHVPVGNANPYQGLLMSHIKAEGFEVTQGTAKGLMPLLASVLHGGMPDVAGETVEVY